MAKVTIYTTAQCPYCHRAKRLLGAKGVGFDEIDVSWDDTLRRQLRVKSGGRTSVPQIWIGETHVGGCDDLHDLERAGGLEAMLNA